MGKTKTDNKGVTVKRIIKNTKLNKNKVSIKQCKKMVSALNISLAKRCNNKLEIQSVGI